MPLLTSRILKIETHSEEWVLARCGRFTSSEIHLLMGEKSLANGAISYIYRKVGESITGQPAREHVDSEATIHGNINETFALQVGFLKRGVNIKLVRTQKMILGEHDLYSSTPDAIQILKAREDVDGCDVVTWECKCPLTYEAFIKLKLCKTPWDIKKVDVKYFFQVLDQMDNCGALTGILVIYHPSFPGDAGINIIEFRLFEPAAGTKFADKIFPLSEEMKLLRQRKKEAIEMFEKIKSQILQN